jgi:hypothetical protein
MQQLPFVWTAECPRLLDRGAFKALYSLAQEAAARIKAEFDLPLALIVIDTIASAAGYRKSGDENDAATTQAVINVMNALSKATGAFVVGVDHFGKNEETGTRGSSAKEGGVDVILAVLGDRSLSGAIENTRMTARKIRGGESGQEFGFAVRSVPVGVDEEGQPETSLIIEWEKAGPSRPEPGKRRWPKPLMLLRRALVNALASHGIDYRPNPGGPIARAVDIEVVRGEFYGSYVADGSEEQKQNTRRQAFNRAIRSTQSRNLIEVRDTGLGTVLWFTDESPL